jgi:hypothetical protein
MCGISLTRRGTTDLFERARLMAQNPNLTKRAHVRFPRVRTITPYAAYSHRAQGASSARKPWARPSSAGAGVLWMAGGRSMTFGCSACVAIAATLMLLLRPLPQTMTTAS